MSLSEEEQKKALYAEEPLGVFVSSNASLADWYERNRDTISMWNLDSEDKILCFFRTYFKHFNETCEMAKDKFKQYYPLIDIDDINLQNKFNNMLYLFSKKI